MQAAASRFRFTLLQVFPVFVVAPIVAQSPRENNRRDEIFSVRDVSRECFT
jgi:hypothetical protein